MVDESTDSSNREQLVLCMRWIDGELEPQEDFIGMYKLDSTDAQSISMVIKDTLVRMNQSFAKCRGQCYDGASTMRGAKSGVSKQITDEEPRVVFMHCYGHALNLVVGDAVKQSKLMKDAMDTMYEVSKLIKYSPKRDVKFEKLKECIAPDTPGIRVLCPTRMTVRADSLKSVIGNYAILQGLHC